MYRIPNWPNQTIYTVRRVSDGAYICDSPKGDLTGWTQNPLNAAAYLSRLGAQRVAERSITCCYAVMITRSGLVKLIR